MSSAGHGHAARGLRSLLAVGALTVALSGCGAERPAPASEGAIATAANASTATSTPATTSAAATDTMGAQSASLDTRFDIGGRSLHLRCIGTGSPTVIFESDLDRAGDAWSAVLGTVRTAARLCTYDRAGTGTSDRAPLRETSERNDAEVLLTPAPGLRTTVDAARDLRALLSRASLAPPYIVVAHGFGGHVVDAFSGEHPGDVAGVVLVDPEPPIWYPAACSKLTTDACAALRATWTPNREGIDVEASQMVGATWHEPVPTVVLFAAARVYAGIGAADSATLDTLWQETVTEAMAKDVSGAFLTVVEGAGHDIPTERPAAVGDALMSVLDAQSSNPWPVASLPVYAGEDDGLRCTRELDLTVTWCQGLHAVAVDADAGAAVAVGRSGTNALVVTSVDGRTWKQAPEQASLKGGTMLDVVRLGERLVAVGAGFSVDEATLDTMPLKDALRERSARSWTSSDGVTWIRGAEGPDLSGGTMTAVAGRERQLVAIGSARSGAEPAAWSSEDGKTWTRAATPTPQGLGPWRVLDVASDAEGFVAIGASEEWETGSGPLIWLSSDGLNWHEAPPDPALRATRFVSITHGPGGFIVVGEVETADILASGAAIWSSPDGSKWTRVATPNVGSTAKFVGIVPTSSGFVAWTSSDYLFPASLQLWRSPNGLDWSCAYWIEYPGFADWYGLAPTQTGLLVVGASSSGDIAARGVNAAVWVTPPWGTLQ